ncbi:hypothetical protein [Saccharothrix sp. NRRL B-16314]|nr:hypothetical protein [Saccharothrix sp. NRRL B-16314]
MSVCRMCPEVCGGDDALRAAQRRVIREAVVDGEPGPTLVDLA